MVVLIGLILGALVQRTYTRLMLEIGLEHFPFRHQDFWLLFSKNTLNGTKGRKLKKTETHKHKPNRCQQNVGKEVFGNGNSAGDVMADEFKPRLQILVPYQSVVWFNLFRQVVWRLPPVTKCSIDFRHGLAFPSEYRGCWNKRKIKRKNEEKKIKARFVLFGSCR